MIVYECDITDTMNRSADLAIKLAKDLGHTIQLCDGDIRVTVHKFDTSEAIVERWKSKLKANQRPKCDTCPHWNKQPDSKFGQCHRFPPRIVNPDSLTGVYSETTANYWCGEHPLMPAWNERQMQERGPDPDIAPSPSEPTVAELKLERDAAREAYEIISHGESAIRAKNLRLTRENDEQRNVIDVHKDTIRAQSREIDRLRGIRNERDKYASAALAGLSALGCTPEKGYVVDGGPDLMAADFKRAKEKMIALQDRADRTNKANAGLVDQLITIDSAARTLAANAVMNGGQEVVNAGDMAELRKAIGEISALRIHKEHAGLSSERDYLRAQMGKLREVAIKAVEWHEALDGVTDNEYGHFVMGQLKQAAEAAQ